MEGKIRTTRKFDTSTPPVEFQKLLAAGCTIVKEWQNKYGQRSFDIVCRNHDEKPVFFIRTGSDIMTRGRTSCPQCNKERLRRERQLHFSEVEKELISRGFAWHDKIYLNNRQRLNLTCICGKPWKAPTLQDIKRGSTCHGKKPKITIKTARTLAKRRGGKCLSKKVPNSKAKLDWQCADGHTFTMSYDNARGAKGIGGHWCSKCYAGQKRIIEAVTRGILEESLGYELPESWPNFLINRRNCQLSLDGYNEEHQVGFEYQGEYHYDKKHRNAKKFKDALENDEDTLLKCKERGIKLIVVPHISKTETLEHFITRIYGIVKTLGISIYKKVNATTFNYDSCFRSHRLTSLTSICNIYSGKLLTSCFLGVYREHNFLCKNGHTFPSTPANIVRRDKSGLFCEECEYKKYVAEVHNICRQKKFTALEIPRKRTAKLLLRCKVCQKEQPWLFSNVKNTKADNPCSKDCKSVNLRNGRLSHTIKDLKKLAYLCDYTLVSKKFTTIIGYYEVICNHCKKLNSVSGSQLKRGQKCNCQGGKRISEARTKYTPEFYLNLLEPYRIRVKEVVAKTISYSCLDCGQNHDKKNRFSILKTVYLCRACKKRIPALAHRIAE